MTQVFDFYARYYDLLYRDKDYAGEADYVQDLLTDLRPDVANVLELGCGTAAHAAELAARGIQVHGVDRSESMLERARDRLATLPDDTASRITLTAGDARSVRLGETFEAVLALFHVASYQPTIEDLSSLLETCAAHCEPGGVLLFDFWFGPAVLAQRPELRVKRMQDSEITVTRIAEPEVHEELNLVDVNYEIWIESREHGIEKVSEQHRMRYWFGQELTDMIVAAGFAPVGLYAWMTMEPPDRDDWSACFVCRKTQ